MGGCRTIWPGSLFEEVRAAEMDPLVLLPVCADSSSAGGRSDEHVSVLSGESVPSHTGREEESDPLFWPGSLQFGRGKQVSLRSLG